MRSIAFLVIASCIVGGKTKSSDEECPSSSVGELHFEAKGHHVLLDVFEADERLLDDENKMRRVAIDIVENAGMEMLSIHSHKLMPQGVSVVVALKESHLSIHTWPEHGTALADVFTCGNTNVSDVSNRFVNLLGGSVEKSSISIVRRGMW
jgi:S-adenosylmethionine decarboxylase proenzyme